MRAYKRKLPRRILIALSSGRLKFAVSIENEPDSRPAIIAFNHTNSFDIPVALRAVKQDCVVLVGEQRLGFADKLFFWLAGTVYTDRLSRDDGTRTKEVLVSLLKQGKSVIWFPEGTWNLTDNQLMLPMKWGIIEVARKASVPIVPGALMYNRDDMICSVRFGAPLEQNDLKPKKEAVERLRDEIASQRWELMTRTKMLERSAIDVDELRGQITCAIDEYPSIQWEYEEQCVFVPKNPVSPTGV